MTHRVATWSSVWDIARSAGPRPITKFSAVFLETAPLVPTSLHLPTAATLEASLVNTGSNAAGGFILFCSASTGVCNAPGRRSGARVLLPPGHGCSATMSSNEVLWARLVLIRFGDKKPIDARGSLQVEIRNAFGHGFAIEALPRAGTALVTEAPPQ